MPPVNHSALAKALRRVAESGHRLGSAHGWQPAADSDVRRTWERWQEDALSQTVLEADMQGALLVRTSLEHLVTLAEAISRRRAWVPHTVARTAIEHALRARHLLDPGATDHQRAARRLNEWMYAISEADVARRGIIEAGHPGTEDIPADSGQLARAQQRANAAGLELSPNGERVLAEKRPTTIALGELYLAGDGGGGVAAWAMRRLAAMVHGTEIGLLTAVAEKPGPAGVNLLEPAPMVTPALAYELMPAVLAPINAIRSLNTRFAWPDVKQTQIVTREQEHAIEVWEEAVTEHLDEVAPERPRSGLFGEIGHVEIN